MPTCISQPSLEDTRAVASVLFHQFARDRFLQAGLEEPQDFQLEPNDSPDYVVRNNNVHNGGIEENVDFHHQSEQATTYEPLMGLSTPMLASYGRELRRIAEQFEQTRMRQEIRDKAGQVRLSDIHRESFTQLLEQLFHGGITRERVAILFFFCTDVALQAVSFGPGLVSKLLGWSLTYIRDRVCLWIHKLGGWDAVLNRYVPSVLVTACAILGICAFAIYIRKNL